MQYAWMRGLLIGVAGDEKELFSEAHAVKLVQSFSRLVEHNVAHLDSMERYVESRNLASPSGLVSLFKA